jgi:arylsulfatase A-like enzyme
MNICVMPLLLALALPGDKVSPPNLIVILADDIGYGDLGCYGATKVKTPNLDRLAAEGLRFSDAHSAAAVCTPSRYALLTGQYPFRHPAAARILSGIAPLSIPADRLTLPKLLRRANHATGVIGKWHLGLGENETDYNVEIKPGPREVGFDDSLVIPATGDRTPCVFVENGRVFKYDPADPIRVSYSRKIGDEPTGKENPEQLFNQRPSHGHDGTIVNGISRIGWMTGGRSARWKDEDIAAVITARAVRFIEEQRDRPFFLYFATHDVHVPRAPHPRFRGTSQHGLRGDAIHELDWSVGEILATLDKLHLSDQTLVLFSSDNGGVMDDGYLDGTQNPSSHRCNGPLRDFKGSSYEGGSRVPWIARWPGHVPAGQVSAELVCHVDLLATMASLTGQKLSAADAPDSFDLLPALLASKPARPCREGLVLQAGDGARLAVREGNWKLIPAGPKQSQVELFDLGQDLAETTNVAARHPEVVARLQTLLERAKTSDRTRP